MLCRLKSNMQARGLGEGPSNSGITASEIECLPVVEDSTEEERYDPKLLRAIFIKRNINGTKSLVAAYNAATDRNERVALFGWLLMYGRRSEECLTPESVLEYSELAKIAPRSIRDKGLLRNLVHTLCSCVCQGGFLRSTFAVALHKALVRIDPSVYSGAGELVAVAKQLLSSLSPEPELSVECCAEHEATFLALNQAFYLIDKMNQTGMREKEQKELRRLITEKEKEMDLSSEYYSVNFHFKALRQAVERFELKDPSSHVLQAMWCGLCGFLHILHCLRNLMNCDIDPVAIVGAFRGLRQETEAFGVSKKPWFDMFRALMAARLEASKDETKLAVFGSECDTAMESQRNIKGNELKALRFGILQEIRQLASQTSSEAVRKEATTKLLALTTSRAIFEEWFDDADVFIAFLDALHEIHTTSGDNQETAEAFRQIRQSCEGHAKSALEVWLGGNAMEDKLEMRHLQEMCAQRNKVFVRIGRDVGYVHVETIRSNIRDLKEKYKHDKFAKVSSHLSSVFDRIEIAFLSKVPSLFGTEFGYHVKEMEHHVVVYEEVVERTTAKRREDGAEEAGAEDPTTQERDHPREHYEQKRKVAKPISLEDLFKPRSLKPGDPESEIRKVLLYGNPGSGKTCISKAIAHKWALGETMQEFEAIYVVPIRRINVAKSKGLQGVTLKDVVAPTCFRERSGIEYEDLLTQVEGDLDLPTTLLVFDGLDEAREDSRELVQAAEERLCKLLILTRPYNLQQIRERVDCEFECLGFNDQQLRNYINKELRQDEALTLIRSLQQDRGMWETAHIPVTAHIICSLSKERGIAIEDQGKRASVFQIYGDMTNYVWKRFKQKQGTKKANKDIVFGDLESIAFEALRKGQILIEEWIVERYVTSTNTTELFKESGFLLFVMEGQQYQFPHLTFQEYFAGRFVAKSLKNKGSDEEKRVLKFIQEGKYDKKNDLTMHFAMHAFARGRGQDALQTMLSTFDNQPVEVLGIRHFFLKTRILEATLEEADDDELEDLIDDEQAIELAEGARQLLERTIDDVLIREIVVEEFQNLSFFLEGFPQILDATIDGLKEILRCWDTWTQKTLAKIDDVLKLARNSPTQSNIIIQFVLQPAGWCHPVDRIKRLSFIEERMPHHTGKLLPTLVEGCADEDSTVRYFAMETLSRIVEKRPQHASELLETLVKGCADEDSGVRSQAMNAVDQVVKEAPQHTRKLLPTLAKGCADEDMHVRLDAEHALYCVVAKAPQYVGEVLPTLAKWRVDEDPNLSGQLEYEIDHAVEDALENTGELLPTLVRQGGDEDADVRATAMKAISRVVEVAPLHTSELLPTLVKGCADEDSDVRRYAIETISRVVAEAPQFVSELLPTLAKEYAEKDWDVRCHVVKAISCVFAEASQSAGELLSTLAMQSSEEDSDVRCFVVDVFGSVVEAAPQHAGELLTVLAKGCVDEDSDVRFVAMEAIGRTVEAAPQQAGELLPMLVNGCADEDSYVRRYAMKAIGSVVERAPKHAGELLTVLVRGCADEDPYVRRYTMETISRVLAEAPQFVSELLPMLVNGCADEDSDVRRYAMKAIGSVVERAPKHAGELLTVLVRGCADEDPYVRRYAMETISHVVAEAPQFVSELLPMLTNGCADEDSDVRRYAMKAIGSVVERAPTHAGKLLPMLKNGCTDEDSHVRANTMKAIGSVVERAPTHAGKLLPMLKNGCTDEDSHVRANTMKAIGSVVERAPTHAGKLLPMLTNGCADEDSHVRANTMKAIGSVVERAPQFVSELRPRLAKEFTEKHWDVRCHVVEAISCVVAEASQSAGELLSTLTKQIYEEDSDVHCFVADVIISVVEAAPQHARELLLTLAEEFVSFGRPVHPCTLNVIERIVAESPQLVIELLPMLSKVCAKNDSHALANSIEVIRETVAEAAQYAGELLPTLARGCADNESYVRRYAMETVSRVVAEAPQFISELLPILVKGCADEDSDVRRYAMESISRVVAEAPKFVGELLPTLAKGCADEDSDVRRYAMKAIGSVVERAPKHAGELLPMLANGCTDEDSHVRANTMKAIGGGVEAAPQHAGELLPMLAKGCTDKDSHVRANTMKAIGGGVEAAPQHAGELLPMLAKGCADEDSDVRRYTMETISRVLAEAPQFVSELLPMLVNGCSDEDSRVRANTMKAIGRGVEAAPQKTGELLPMLANGCTDEDSHVRSWATEAVRLIVLAAPQHTDVLLPTVAKKFDSFNWRVRHHAIKAVVRVIAEAPQNAGTFLPMLAECRVGGEDEVERNLARTALKMLDVENTIISTMSAISDYKAGLFFFFVLHTFTFDQSTKRKTIPFVLHTTSSFEIAKWSKDDVDKFVKLLRQEFDEKFPGLLGHVEMKEYFESTSSCLCSRKSSCG